MRTRKRTEFSRLREQAGLTLEETEALLEVSPRKSLILTDEGLERSEALFRELFTRPPQ